MYWMSVGGMGNVKKIMGGVFYEKKLYYLWRVGGFVL